MSDPLSLDFGAFCCTGFGSRLFGERPGASDRPRIPFVRWTFRRLGQGGGPGFRRYSVVWVGLRFAHVSVTRQELQQLSR